MYLFFDSFWRALVYCLHPKVIFWSLLPLLVMVVLSLGLGYFFWDSATDQLRLWLESSASASKVWGWLDSVGAQQFKSVLVSLLLVFAVTPLIVVLSMLLVAQWLAPAVVKLVASKRFAGLQARQGAGFVRSLAWALSSTLLALLALVVTLPLWLVPVLALLLPPLIWGWLTYRVMAFDALAQHASVAERRTIFQRHRGGLLLIGLLTGYLNASPGLALLLVSAFAPAFMLILPLVIGWYMLVFAFASLWYAHYCLGALQVLRLQEQGGMPDAPVPASSVLLRHEPGPGDTA